MEKDTGKKNKIDALTDNIVAAIEASQKNHEINTCDIVGALEVVKFDVLNVCRDMDD